MACRRRHDGDPVTGLPGLRRILPYLMPTRGSATVYYPMRIEVDRLLEWLATTNAGRPPQQRLSFFHVALTAVVRTLWLRPELNRFVAGGRTYQHAAIGVTFVVKAELTEAAPESEAHLVFHGQETVAEVRDATEAATTRERSGRPGGDDRLIGVLAPLPRPVLRVLAALVRWLDGHRALPASFVDAVPLFTSVYLVNAGSIGIDPPYHHLYEYGSASAFVSIGRIAPAPVVTPAGEVVARPCVDIVFTLDERVTDGFYFARTAEVFRRLVAQPWLLAEPAITTESVLGSWPHPE